MKRRCAKIEYFWHIFFPNRCLFCEKPIAGDEVFCSHCESEQPLLPAVCSVCQNPVGECTCSIPVFSVFRYEEGAQSAIHAMKFIGDRVAAQKLAQMMADRLYDLFGKKDSFDCVVPVPMHPKDRKDRGFSQSKWLAAQKLAQMMADRLYDLFGKKDSFDCVVPVPMHPKDRKDRGFSQSKWLAQALSKQISVPCDADALKKVRRTKKQHTLSAQERKRNLTGAFSVNHPESVCGRRILLVDDADALKKVRRTKKQHTLSAQERKRNLTGAFSVNHPESVCGRRILLVDDVFTTGATVFEIADVLLCAGASAVTVIVAAKTAFTEKNAL